MKLPAGFEDLGEFVERWDAPSAQARWMRRCETPYSEIVRFYDAIVERAEAATVYVEQFPLNEMPEDAARLFRLVLALMQATIAVELHQAARVPNSPFPHGLRIVAGMQPFG